MWIHLINHYKGINEQIPISHRYFTECFIKILKIYKCKGKSGIPWLFPDRTF
jgi:hypothetical protein